MLRAVVVPRWMISCRRGIAGWRVQGEHLELGERGLLFRAKEIERCAPSLKRSCLCAAAQACHRQRRCRCRWRIESLDGPCALSECFPRARGMWCAIAKQQRRQQRRGSRWRADGRERPGRRRRRHWCWRSGREGYAGWCAKQSCLVGARRASTWRACGGCPIRYASSELRIAIQ